MAGFRGVDIVGVTVLGTKDAPARPAARCNATLIANGAVDGTTRS